MFAQISDTKIFYDVVGAGFDSSTPAMTAKPVIIVLNGGYGFDHAYIRPSLESLSSDYQIIFTDMRGQGRSPAVNLNTVTFEGMAKDVNDFMDAIGIEKAFILGHQTGSYIAQYLAKNYPDRVQGLILVATTMGFSAVPTDDDDQTNKIFLVDRTSDQALITLASDYIFQSEPFSAARNEQYWRNVGPYYMGQNNMDQFDSIYAYVTQNIDMVNHYRSIYLAFNSQPFYKDIVAPSLICSGKWDWAESPVSGQMLATRLVGSTFVFFEESGHFPFIEEQDKFNDAVKTFISAQTS